VGCLADDSRALLANEWELNRKSFLTAAVRVGCEQWELWRASDGAVVWFYWGSRVWLGPKEILARDQDGRVCVEGPVEGHSRAYKTGPHSEGAMVVVGPCPSDDSDRATHLQATGNGEMLLQATPAAHWAAGVLDAMLD
jgi:hypothetical protein